MKNILPSFFSFYHDVYILRGFDNVDSVTRFQKVDTSVRITRSAADSLNLKPQAARLEIRRHFFSNRVVEGWNLIPSELKNARTVHLKALTDHLGGGSRVDSFDPQW